MFNVVFARTLPYRKMHLYRYIAVGLICHLFGSSNCSIFLNQRINYYIDDLDSNESFLSIFMTIYHMTWTHQVHFDRVINAIRDFEENPLPLYHDETSLQIVCEQIIFGFVNRDNNFLLTRSRRLLQRILRNRPTRRVLSELIGQAGSADVAEVRRFIRGTLPVYVVNPLSKIRNNFKWLNFYLDRV